MGRACACVAAFSPVQSVRQKAKKAQAPGKKKEKKKDKKGKEKALVAEDEEKARRPFRRGIAQAAVLTAAR